MLPTYSSEIVNESMFDDDDSNMFPAFENEGGIPEDVQRPLETSPERPDEDGPLPSPSPPSQTSQPLAPPSQGVPAEDDNIPSWEEQMEMMEMEELDAM